MNSDEKTCRVCLESSIEINDFSTYLGLDENSQMKIVHCFNLCTNLKAKQSDEFTNNFCNICLNELQSAYSFIQKAIKSDKLLREKFNNVEKSTTSSADYIECIIQNYDEVEDELNVKEEILEYEIHELHGSETEGIIYAPLDIKIDEKNSIETIEQVDLSKISSNTINTKTDESISEKYIQNNTKKVHLCNICGRTCSHRSSLESHLLQHKGERPFNCQQCDKSYFTKNGLQLHEIGHKNEQNSDKFLCSTCGRNFATHQRLRVHSLVHTGEKNYSCTSCPKKFGTLFRLRNHIRTHTGERPFECKTCGVKFTQRNALKCHERIHTGEKPYKCKICGKSFTQNTILKTHMTLHTGKTVQCPNCDKKFSRPSHLILHQREHTGEKPYACDKCPNRYKQKSHLDRHMDTHLGVKHPCPECGKEYSKRSSLRIHMFEHSDQKPFQCADCSMTFNRRDKYRNHLRKLHNKIFVDNNIVEILNSEQTEEIIIQLTSEDNLMEINNVSLLETEKEGI